jgi:hypothetical protein
MRLLVSMVGDEVWVAIATRAEDGAFVDERLRDVRTSTLKRVLADVLGNGTSTRSGPRHGALPSPHACRQCPSRPSASIVPRSCGS